MLPLSFETPAAIVFLIGGMLSCFAGYRLFKLVLGIYGFILGANLASSMMGASHGTQLIAAALVGGVLGACILVFAYFIGIALVGAGLGALVAHVGWGYVRTGDPPAVAIVALAVVGAIGAMLLQRYVIIVSTAFAGAWTLILGGFAMGGDRAADRPGSVGDVWILNPTMPATGQRWVPIAWFAIGLIGTAVQLGITGRKK
jgi:hypothetical protein